MSSAQATPIVYTFTSGTLTLTATDSAGTVLNPTVVSLTGTQVTFDSTALTLPSFSLTGGPTSPIALTGNLTGELLTISSFSATPGAGYGNIAPMTGSNPYLFTVGPLATTSTLSGTGLVTFGPKTNSNTPAAATGQIQTGDGGTLTLNGITIGVLNFPTVGTVTVKADVIFNGAPEPGTALLLGSGLVALGAVARRRAHS